MRATPPGRSGCAAAGTARGSPAPRRPWASRAACAGSRRRCPDAPTPRGSARKRCRNRGGGDRAGLGPGVGVVLQVGHVAVQRRIVGGPERHPPQRIVGARRGRGELGRQGVARPVERRHVGAERHARRAGQGGEVDGQVRPELARAGQRIGQDQPALPRRCCRPRWTAPCARRARRPAARRRR